MALEKIGPYEFQGILGRGGMGSVYRGIHKDTGEVHAVKVLAPTYAHDDHFRGRFESEIKALLKLDHRNIVRLLSFGQEDGMLFFSMELVEGNSLFQMQRNGKRFDWREVLAIAKDVAHGLRHAHDRGIIHRDLKPGNLLMTIDDDGEPDYVKITDFGIAKRYGSSQNTGHNVLGTMDFMSPEQAKGEPVTIRSDLYSLGTVMFTLLSGRPPFSANSVEESLRNLTRVPAPHINAMVQDVPDQLDELIWRLMAKRPENRIPTAQSLLYQIDDVESFLKENSEARTIHRSPVKRIDDTFQIATPRTKENTRPKGVSGESGGDNARLPTIEHTDHSEDLVPLSSTHVDYFETVSDETRQEVDSPIESQSARSGVWIILIAFVAVIALGGYGIYQATRPPNAEELYTAIEMSVTQPNRVLDEIDQFLRIYPDDERVDQITEMKRVGEAIVLYNTLCTTLSVRRNLPGETRLTEIEKQFLLIVDIADENPVSASKKMAAFVMFHEGSQLSLRDEKCIEAAKGYQLKIENDARTKILTNLKQIRSALARASRTTVPDEAIEIYRSVLELYGNVRWGSSTEAAEGRELVKKARDMLSVMEAAKIKAEQATQDNEVLDETVREQ